MPTPNFEHSPLVKELVDTLLSKFEKMPTVDRNLVVIASIEATAWIATMESISYCNRNGLNKETMRERFEEYCKIFEATGAMDLGKPD